MSCAARLHPRAIRNVDAVKLPPALRFSARELSAIAIALGLVCVGLWLGVTVHADWLSRFGALVIIVGVIFAVSELPKALERRARAIAKVTSALLFRDLVTQLEEKDHQTLTQSERDGLWRRYEKLNEESVERAASLPRRRFLVVEASIVCVGTFFNGFGQWVVTLLCAST